MTDARMPRPLVALLSCGMAALGACTSQAELRKAELANLAVQLPGVYANPQQLLVILNLASPLVGEHVFYVRETAASDVRRVISEHIWSLDVATEAHIVGTVYALDEPDRWRGGAESPELFRSLMRRDLRPLAGCELLWEKSPRGFSAVGASTRCPQSWRLEGDELAFSDRTAGATPEGSDHYFHFVREGGAP